MLPIALFTLVTGYALMYAGVKGTNWQQPWQPFVDYLTPHKPGTGKAGPGSGLSKIFPRTPHGSGPVDPLLGTQNPDQQVPRKPNA